MDNEAISKLSTVNWDDAGPRLLEFARRWASMIYGWREGATLPNGMSIEDVVKDAVAAFATGDRKINPRFELPVQLKGAIRSILWKIHRKSGDKLTSAESPEFFDAQLEDTPDPAARLASEDFFTSFLEQLSADEKIAGSSELLTIVQAYAGGAETVDEVANKTGLVAKRIYELRRHLKEAAARVLKTMNRKENAI